MATSGSGTVANSGGNTPEKDNPLHLSWQDSAWITHLNQATVMDYFSERSNPFYDRQCNNEIIKMQKRNPDQLKTMTGLEYELIYIQEPVLFVIRKHDRQSPDRVIPLTYYYIIAGIIYQAPDLNCVINSRLTTALFNIQSAFEEVHSFSRYHPSKGYWWEFKDQKQEKDKKNSKKAKEELSTLFQRQRVDILLGEMARKFPPKVIQPKVGDKPVPVNGTELTITKEEPKDDQGQMASNANSSAMTSSASSSGVATQGSGPFMSGPSNITQGAMKPPLAKKRKLGK